MSKQDDKRRLRREKRDIKRDGRRQHRRELKQQLDSAPEDVSDWEGKLEYDRSTAKLNGSYKDTKRYRGPKKPTHSDDLRTLEEKLADASALQAFEAGELLRDRDKEAAAVARARACEDHHLSSQARQLGM